jgi:dienelactone hydrolase
MTSPEVVVEDVTFAGEVAAWLVRPASAGGGSCAGLVMWHWLDTEAPDGNRDEFLDEARELASRGVVALLPQGRFPWSIAPSGSAADAEEVRREVARLTAGLDLLAGRPEVDDRRLGVVGHDFGAMLGVLAAADDDRVRCLALIAPTPRWGDWFLPFWPIEEDRIAYLAAMRPLDPVEAIARMAPRPILLQLAQRDFYIPVMAGFELRRAAGGADVLDLRTYDAEHDVRVPEARTDRLAFLERTVGIGAAG